MTWKLALNHANIFIKQQTVDQMSDYELLSPDNIGSGWEIVLLVQKINKRGVAIRMSLYAFFEKINSWGGTSIPDWRVYDSLHSIYDLLHITLITTVDLS